MAENTGRPIIWPFWLEASLTAIIPFIIWWSITPTDTLNSSPSWMLLELVGLCGSALLFFAGIPLGIIGIWAAKKMDKQRMAAIVLSVINLSTGIIEVGVLILMFCAAIFGGASV